MYYKFITIEHPLYKQAVAIRIAQFFKKEANVNALIHDEYEKESKHLICVYNESVIGTGRLTIKRNKGVISQMAIVNEYQGKGIGTYILDSLVTESRNNEIEKVQLSARVTAITFYEKNGFITIGKRYSSKKTGIQHQNMEFIL